MEMLRGSRRKLTSWRVDLQQGGVVSWIAGHQKPNSFETGGAAALPGSSRVVGAALNGNKEWLLFLTQEMSSQIRLEGTYLVTSWMCGVVTALTLMRDAQSEGLSPQKSGDCLVFLASS